jgi:hypothetical protein
VTQAAFGEDISPYGPPTQGHDETVTEDAEGADGFISPSPLGRGIPESFSEPWHGGGGAEARLEIQAGSTPSDSFRGQATISGTARVILADTVLLDSERGQVEVIVRAVVEAIQEDPRLDHLREEVAQLQAAVDVLQAMLRAQEPSRGVVAWALRQIKAFPNPILSGVAIQYVPELLKAMHV